MNVGDLSAQLSAVGGLQSPNRFAVRMTVPGLDSRLIEYTCDSFDLPGLTMATTTVRNLGYGPSLTVPLVPSYGDVNLSVMVDSDDEVMSFFEDWRRLVAGVEYEPGGAMTAASSGTYPFQVRYPADYAGVVQVMLIDKAGEVSSVTTLHDAWPVFTSTTKLNWADKDQIMRLQVTLSYRSWTRETQE